MAHPTTEYLELSDGITAFVVEHVIPSGGTTNMMGLPFTGKSFAILQLAAAIADPTIPDWLGFPVYDHGPVVVAQFDTPRLLWANRIRTLQRRMSFQNVFWLDRLDAPPAFNVLNHAHASWLRDEIQAMDTPPKVVIFDVLRELHRGDEDSSDHMQKVIDALVRAIHPAALMLISHTRKPTWTVPREVQDEDMNENRGSIYVNGRMDTVLKLTRKFLFMESRTAPKLRVPIRQDSDGLWSLSESSESPLNVVTRAQAMDIKPDSLRRALRRQRAKASKTLSISPTETLNTSTGEIGSNTDPA